MRKLLASLALTTALIAPAFAADNLPTKAWPTGTATGGYPSARCGLFYGVGIGGSAGAVTSSIASTQIVQGDLSANIGYTCPFATYGFWFAEVSGGVANLNGGTILANNSIGGLSLSGNAVFMERFAAGSPINALLGGLLPGGNNLLNGLAAAMPSVPLLPAGITLSPANAYLFAGIVEADYGATLGLAASSHQWMISPIIGVGSIARASNNVAIDTWAGFQFGSTNSFCPGGGTECGKLGNMVRVGSSLKF